MQRETMTEKLSNLLAKRLRVLLHLLKDHAHGWVAHNLLYLRISHGSFLHLLRTVIPHCLTDHTALHALCGFLKATKTDDDKKSQLINMQQIWMSLNTP